MRGARPGVTTMEELLESFGEPAQRSTQAEDVVLGYWNETAPAGTRGVQFRVSQQSGRLQRIDVFPETPPSRALLDEEYGPACGSAKPKKADKKKPADKASKKKPAACYVVKITSGNRFYFHYATLGLAIFFDQQQVQSLAYVLPSRAKRPLKKEAPLDEPPALPQKPEPTVAPAPAPEPEPTVAQAAPPEPAPAPAPVASSETTPPPEPLSFDTSLRRPTVVETETAAETAPATAKAPTTARAGSDTPPDRALGVWTEEEENSNSSGSGSLLDEVNSKNDFLDVGGFFYQRADLAGSRLGTDTQLQPRFPALVRVYLDARPMERLRSFVVGRLVYDPLDVTLSTPQPGLDQLWFNFDLGRLVFITVGRQQIKWGSSQIWNPTDFLQQPNPQPLEGIDLRTGVDMLKLNVPIAPLGAHLTLIASADLHGPAEDRLRYGGAVRADVALGPTGELGFSASFLQQRRPRYGLDLSMGVGPVDLNAEVALVRDTDVRLWERAGTGFAQRAFGGPKLLASGGLSTQFRLADLYRVALRFEGFYNSLGYDDRAFLTLLQSTGDYRGLFFGRYYAMGQAIFSRRSSFYPSLIFTNVVNVLDRSLLSRVDFSLLVTPSTRIFIFAEVPFGERGSEFLYQPDPTVVEDAAPVGLGLFRAGINIRMRM
ncbi:hypothetical protein [Archangium gephyra]|nr:hypothetical protein [Archangium gephyra]